MEIDSTGRTYTVKYTEINGKSRIESIEDTTADRIVEYEYNSQLQVSKEKTSIDIANNVYAVREYEYDKFNNVTKISDYGTGSTAAVTITEYDKLSRKTAEYSPNYSADKSHGTTYTYYPSGSVKTQTDALGNLTSFEYNAYGNTIQQTNPDGTISMVEYDGLQREKAAYFKANINGIKQILTSDAYEFETYTAPEIANAKSPMQKIQALGDKRSPPHHPQNRRLCG